MRRSLPFVSTLFAMVFMAAPGAAQDAEAGEKVFKKCVACHQIGAEAKNKTGPVLNGIVGQKAAAVEGFKYRDDLVAAGEKGLVWTEENLVAYLADPTGFLREYLGDSKARSGMSLKLTKEQERLDVVAFLKTAGSEEAAAAEPETPVETRSADEVIADQSFSEEFLANAENVAAGKEIWFSQCTHCHGFKAYPGKAPKLKPAKYTPEFVFKRTYKGFKKMPAWNDTYSIDEIRQIVAYVMSKDFAP